MTQQQILRFNRHQVRGKMCGAYVFIPKNTTLWAEAHKVGETTDWSVCSLEGQLYLRPYTSRQMTGWHDVKVQQVKSGAFRLYINLDACPEIEHLPKKFSIEGNTVVTPNIIAWAGVIPKGSEVPV